MSLRDLACYTLILKPHEKDSKVTELVSVENGREEHRFARVRDERDGEAYSSSIYGMSLILLGAGLSNAGWIEFKMSRMGSEWVAREGARRM